MDCFLWHLCSWGKVKCLEGEEAKTAFKKQRKNKCTIFYQFINEAYLIENAKTLAIEDLPYNNNQLCSSDIYIMDWDTESSLQMIRVALTRYQVSELVGIGQSTASEQLAILKKAGLLSSRKEGKKVFYSTDRNKIMELLESLNQILTDCCK